MIADIEAVAAYLERQAPDAADLAQYHALQRLVAIAREERAETGDAVLAGLWLGDGMPEHEIVARIWPGRQRFHVVKG